MKLLYNKHFNKKELKRLFEEVGDYDALEYLYDNEIIYYKIDNFKFTKEEYIKKLYDATMSLNTALFINEQTSIENKFNFDTYAIVRDKLLEELGLLF